MKKTAKGLILTALMIIALVSCDKDLEKEETSETLPVILYTDEAAKVDITETSEVVNIIEVTEAETIEPPRFPIERLQVALNDLDKIDETFKAIADEYAAFGISIAVFANGEVIYTFNDGYSDKSANIKANDNTKYRCASVSKTATALCALILAENGGLDLDASVSEILGLNIDYNGVITTRHLLTHTAGLINSRAYIIGLRQKPPYTLAQIVSEGVWSGAAAGTQYSYCNFGGSIVAAVIESATGERFYDYARDNLFSPLGMDAAYIRDYIKDDDDVANLYSGGGLAYSVKTWGRTSALYSQIPLGQSYGLAECELIISASDLAKIGIILSGDGSVNGVKLLSQERVDEAREAFITVGSEAYGMGLRSSADIIEGRTITGHPGQALGMVSGLYFDASDGTGIAILTNGCLTGLTDNGMYAINDEVAKAAYEMFFD